jgi:hypothetical protein
MGFSSYQFFYLVKEKLKQKKYDKFFFLSLFFFMFTVIFFYRIAEHGTDRSAQILIFLLIIELLILINLDNHFRENSTKFFVL